MLRRPRLGLIAFLVLATQATLGDGPRTSSAADVQHWIDQLGDDTYHAREVAAQRLLEAGLAARPAVQKGLEDQDPEVRLRCQQILAQIEQREEQRILQAFLDEQDPQKDHGLAGWKAFRDIVGDSLATRTFYVELHKAEKPLLAAMARGSKDLSELFAARLAELQRSLSLLSPVRGPRRVPLANSAALLFIAGDANVNLAGQNVNLLIHQSELYQQLTSGDQNETLRKLLGRFVARETDPTVMYTNLNLALRFDLKEGLRPALKLAQQDKAPAAHRMYALLVIAKFGTREHGKPIEPLLADTTVVYTRGPDRLMKSSTTQLRDVALAATIHLHGGKLDEFGFAARSHSQLLYLPYSLGFPSDTEREAALAKYRQWAKAQPK